MRCKTIQLSKAADIIVGFPFASEKFNLNAQGIRLVRGKNITTGNLRWGDDTRWWDDFSIDLSKYMLKADDIVIGMDGSLVGKNYAKISENDLPLLLVQRVACIRAKEGYDQRFLWGCIASGTFERYIDSIKTGTSIPHISGGQIGNYPIPDFDLQTQKKIAAILSALDEKIAINRAINENLERQALALFRQYFVDFAPYGGFAPSDWTEVSLDDVCTRITDGSHYSPADAPESPYPMYSVKDMETYGFNFSSCKHITEEDFRKMQKGDCVPLLNDILVAKDGSYLKEIFICSEEKDEAILSSIAIFRPDTNIIMPEILLYLLKQPSVRKDVGDNYVSGSALPRIVLKDFKKYRFMLPPMDEQAKIGSVLHSIRMQTKANVDEIQRLSSLRDTLLPRLMSGKLDVSDLDL